MAQAKSGQAAGGSEVTTEDDLWSETPKPGNGKGKPKPAAKPKVSPADLVPDDQDSVGEDGQMDDWVDAAQGHDWGAAGKPRPGAEPKQARQPVQAPVQRPVQPPAKPRVKSPEIKPRPQPAAPDRAPPPRTAAPTSETPPAKPALADDDLVPLPDNIVLPEKGLDDLMAIWQERRQRLQQMDLAGAALKLDAYMALKEELGIRNAFLEAFVLTRDAERARLREDPQSASALLDAAVKLAPDSSQVYLARAWANLRAHPLALGALFSDMTQAVRADLLQPLGKQRALVNELVVLLLAFGLLSVLFSLQQILRYGRLFVHDFHHLFPTGVANIQTGFLAVVVLLLPVLFQAGFMVTLLVWLLVASLYQTLRERVITSLVLVYFLVAPLGLQQVVAGLALPGSRVGDAVEVVYGRPTQKSIQRLEAGLSGKNDSPEIHAILASHARRLGRLDRAAEHLNAALKQRPNAAVLHNNLGNVYFLQGALTTAIEQYSQAINLAPQLAIPYFNISRVHYRRLDHTNGAQARRQAKNLDRDLIKKIETQAGSGQAIHAVVDLPLPDSWLLQVASQGETAHVPQASARLWASWGGLGADVAWWLPGVIALGLFGLFWLVVRRMFLSSRCARCGKPACHRCSPDVVHANMCGPCTSLVAQKSNLDAKSRISKEIQIRRYRRRTEAIARGISFVLPGMGQWIKERPLRGAGFLAVFLILVFEFVLFDGVVRSSISMGSGLAWAKLVPLILVFIVCYVWAIWDVFRDA